MPPVPFHQAELPYPISDLCMICHVVNEVAIPVMWTFVIIVSPDSIHI